MIYHSRLLSRAVQVAPESAEVYIWPRPTPATSFVPSADEVMNSQDRLPSSAVQVPNETLED